jgi:hypothetical protein
MNSGKSSRFSWLSFFGAAEIGLLSMKLKISVSRLGILLRNHNKKRNLKEGLSSSIRFDLSQPAQLAIFLPSAICVSTQGILRANDRG